MNILHISKEGTMTKFLSYLISGQGVIPGETLKIINLLRDAGIKFSPSSPCGHSGKLSGKMYFFSVNEIDGRTKAIILARLAAAGIKQPHLEKCGHYVRQ